MTRRQVVQLDSFHFGAARNDRARRRSRSGHFRATEQTGKSQTRQYQSENTADSWTSPERDFSGSQDFRSYARGFGARPFAQKAKGRAGRWLCRCGGCCALEKREQVGVDQICVGCGHAVRKVVIDLERCMLEQFRGRWTRGGNRHNLIVLAMYYQHGNVDLLEVLGGIRLRENSECIHSGP